MKEEEEKELSKCCHAPLEEISQGSGSELNWCSRCGDRCEVEIFIKK